MDHFNFFGLVSEDMAGEWEIVGSMDERSKIGGAWVEVTEEGMKLSVVPCPAVFRVIYSKNKFNITQSETESQMCAKTPLLHRLPLLLPFLGYTCSVQKG